MKSDSYPLPEQVRDLPAAVQRAITAIGVDQPYDWQLKPEVHAADLGPDARLLQEILRRPRLASMVAAYGAADKDAGAAQSCYRRLARLSAWTGFGGASLGALALAAAGVLPPGGALVIAAMLQAVLVLISIGASIAISRTGQRDVWLAKRAEAESVRALLFYEIVSARAEDNARDHELLPLQLEYFRRYQMDVQCLFFRMRGERHAAAVRRKRRWNVFLFLLVAAGALANFWAIGLAGPLAFHEPLPPGDAMQRALLALGIIAVAMQSFLAASAQISRGERNARRFLAIASNLDILAGRPLDEARHAAASAAAPEERSRAREDVLALVALVQEQISAEHSEWLVLRKLAPR